MALTRAVRPRRPWWSASTRGFATGLAALVASAALTVALTAPLAAAPAPERAGATPPGGPQRATREELLTRVAALEAEAASGRKGASRARADLAATRQRLERGDFRVGDRFVLSYRLEKSGVDTVNVRDSLTISVGNMPDLSLHGVLRAELDGHLDRHVAKFLRSYQLRANLLTRVAIFGAVGAPGYRYVPPDRPISDLLMAAGGPSSAARLDDMVVRRDGRVLLDAKAIRRAINEGRTLEELDIQSGDELVVPGRRSINWFGIIQTTTFVTSILLASVQFISWYYGQPR